MELGVVGYVDGYVDQCVGQLCDDFDGGFVIVYCVYVGVKYYVDDGVDDVVWYGQYEVVDYVGCDVFLEVGVDYFVVDYWLCVIGSGGGWGVVG